ncbi:MAG: hypothetical protein IPP57_06100 [Candidatus Obscuribacter sp.]|nr:hypothetical protein [Candidatus Obscuribacter sp.]
MIKLKCLLCIYTTVFLGLTFFTGLFYRFYFFALHPMFIGPDQSVYLAFAQLICKGAIPYRDIYDFNFPLIMYLSTLPVIIAAALPVPWPLPLVFDWFIYGSFALSALLVVAVFVAPKQNKATSPGYLWPVLFALLCLQQCQLQDLGQREHIFVLLYMPFFVLRYFAWTSPLRSGLLKVLLALVCGALACSMHLKPHLFLTVLASELFLMPGLTMENFKRLWQSLEVRTVLVLTVLYVLHFCFYPVSALKIFFEQAVPVYVTGFGWFNTSLLSLFVSDPGFCTTTCLLVIALLVAIPLVGRCRILMPLLGFTLSSLALYVLFITAWTYRYLPVQAGVYMLIAVEVWTLAYWFIQRRTVLARLAIYLIAPPCALVSACLLAGEQMTQYFSDVASVQLFDLRQVGSTMTSPALELSPIFYAIVKNTKLNDRVLFIGTGVAPGYPAVLQAGRLAGSRYLHGMHLPMLNLAVLEERGKKYQDWLSQSVASYGQDIVKNQPKLIFIQGGEITEILQREKFFERYLAAYDNLGLLGFDSLTVYKLKDKTPYSLAQSTVLDIIQGRLSLEDASRLSHMPVDKLSEQVTKTRAAIEESLSKSPGGGELSARADVLKLQEQLFEAQKKIDALKLHEVNPKVR